MEQAYPLNANTLNFHSPSSTYLRGGGLAVLATALLLFAMSQLIANDYVVAPDDPLPQIQEVHIPEMVIVNEEMQVIDPPSAPPPPVTVTETDPSTPEPAITTVLPAPPTTHEGPGSIAMSSDPVPVYRPRARYPAAALRRGLEGHVLVEFTITSNGSVRDPRIVGGYDSAGNPTGVFDSAALAAVSGYKFRPQLADGKPVERRGVHNRITFRLAD